MRQALFADEKLGKIADDKKKSAFLRAIEDRDDDGIDMGLRDGEGDDESQSQSQSQAEGESQHQVAEQQATTSDCDSRKRKRPLETSNEDGSNRLPPNLRRTATTSSKRPSTIAEIRRTVSLLVEEPTSFHSTSFPHHSFSDNENSDQEEERIPNTHDENDKSQQDENDDDLDVVDDTDKAFTRPSYSDRRTNSEPKTSKPNVVDRLSLLRTRTSSLSSSSSRLAFHNPSAGPTPGFRVPPLLRRATTNSSLNSTSTNTSGGFGTERFADDDARTKAKVTIAGGSKKASVNFYQESRLRERERELKGRLGRKGKAMTNVSGTGMAALLGKKGSWD
jgi:mediator of replication checkpoint protein 1